MLPAAVLDHHVLAQFRFEPLCDEAGGDIHQTAWIVGCHDADHALGGISPLRMGQGDRPQDGECTARSGETAAAKRL